jgi:lysophospholipase L1-like esterase
MTPGRGLLASRRGRLLVVLISLVGAAAIAEIALGVYDRREQARLDESPEPFYTWSLYATDGKRKVSAGNGPLKLVLDPYVVYRNLPNHSGLWFSINSMGYRGPEVDTSPEVRRIALVGGSTAFGAGARSDEETFARALDRRLERTQVINAAVIGYVSADELTLLRRELLDLKPSLVLVFDGFNDAGIPPAGNQLWNDSFRGLEANLLELQRIRSNPFSAAVVLAESIFPHAGSRVRRLSRLPAWLRRKATGKMPDETAAEQRRVQIYVENVTRMAQAARQQGIPLLVLLQPERPKDDRMRYYNERYSRFVKTAARALAQRGVEFINLHELPSLKTEHFTDNIHLRAAGAEIIAEHVARHIQARGLLPKR